MIIAMLPAGINVRVGLTSVKVVRIMAKVLPFFATGMTIPYKKQNVPESVVDGQKIK
jgi:hypothetical protein